VRAVIDEADLLLAIGSRNSSNSQRLVQLARQARVPARLIHGAGDIHPAWPDDASVAGLTAGASAPMVLVREVVRTLGAYDSVGVIEREVARETMRFALLRTVRNR